MKLLFSYFWHELTHTRISLWVFLATLTPLLVLFFCDHALLANLRLPDPSPAHTAAQWLSRWGDFYTGCAFAMLGILLAGILLRQKKLQLLALCMFLSALLAGVSATTLRFFSGRPRPSAQVADGLYGPRFERNAKGTLLPSYNYASLPSAHAVTAMATAVPVLFVQPAIGIPLTAAAVAVGWSRFQLNRHRPSDIYLGFLVGTFFGIAFGRALRRTLRENSSC